MTLQKTSNNMNKSIKYIQQIEEEDFNQRDIHF